MIHRIVPIFLLIVLMAPMALGITAAIGNARVILEVEGSPENPAVIERTLKVINKNDVPVMIHLNPSDELRHFITIIDSEFELAPGETKDAAFILRIDRGGNFDTVLNVLFSPIDPESKDADVGLSSRMIIKSIGPDIPFPEEENQETEETIEEEIVEETPTPEENPLEETPSAEENENEQPVKVKKPSANLMIGIGIMALIIVVGLGIFFIVMKFAKK